MKIRTDFVSNSSSSSFLIMDIGFFAFFGITKQDIFDAIVELYGGRDYIAKKVEEAIAHHERLLDNIKNSEEKDDWSIEYHSKRINELKTKGLEAFCVYDMKDEKERKECFKIWDDHFSSWWAPNEGESHDWQNMLDIFRWKCEFHNVDEVLNGEANELETSTYDKKSKKYVHTPFPDGANFIKHIKNSLKVKTMKDVLHDKKCTLMIHFDENEVYNIKGMSDYGKADEKSYHSEETNKECKASKWDSESYSVNRFFEILIRYFVEKRKIDLSNPDFLEYWKIDEKDFSYKKDHPNDKYYLKDGIATWKDVVDDCLHQNSILHEG